MRALRALQKNLSDACFNLIFQMTPLIDGTPLNFFGKLVTKIGDARINDKNNIKTTRKAEIKMTTENKVGNRDNSGQFLHGLNNN